MTDTTLPRHSAMPEFLSPRHDGVAVGSWSVEDGRPVRGDAWTRLDEMRMRVPVGNDETTRLIRAHEMMHARVSPISPEAAYIGLSAFTPRVVECSEEFRINTLVSRAGFDLSALADGSESKSGKRLTENEQWAEAVCFLTALAGTKAASDFLRGVRSANPEWAKSLRAVEKALVKRLKKVSHRNIGNTMPDDSTGLPQGFIVYTRRIAEIVTAAIKAGEKSVTDEFGDDIDGVTETVSAKRIEDAMSSVSGGAGVFAALRLDNNVALTRHVSGAMGRKRIATNVGRNPRRIHRIMTDPERRIFDRTTKGQGGIVLIDQSGSMSMSDTELWEIINSAPGCVIIGYSHATGSPDTPNTWVLAERGRVCSEIREGNGGNGVDGPALRFALSKRKHGEPVIWVCDGLVTAGGDDCYYPNLGEECASLVIRHGVHMVDTVREAKNALERAKRGVRLPARLTGHLRSTVAAMNAGLHIDRTTADR